MRYQENKVSLQRLTSSPSLIAILLSLVLAPFAYAQVDLSRPLAGEGSDVTITMTPNSPTPGETVNFSVESSLLDLTNSTIQWHENGKIIAQGVGMTNASVMLGALGTTMNIAVSLVTENGTPASAQITVVPTQVDLLVDSDSYVPPFYLGRALPTSGTDLRLQAIPHFKRPNGALVPSSDIIYTWKQGGLVVGNVSGRGKASVTLPSATLYGTSDIEVDAISSDGKLSGSASLSLPSVTPTVMLYEDNPLLGLMYYHALGSQASIPEVKMTFAAVPYFTLIQSPNDPRLAYAWTINGTNVTPSANDPSELALNGANSSGQASIGLNLTHATDIFMSADGAWQVTLGATNSGYSASAPAGTKDPFSGQNQ